MKLFCYVPPHQFPDRRHEASDHRFAPVSGDLPCDTDCSFWYRLLCQVPILPVRSLRLFVDVGSFYGAGETRSSNPLFAEHNLARPIGIRYIASAAKSTFSPLEVFNIRGSQ